MTLRRAVRKSGRPAAWIHLLVLLGIVAGACAETSPDGSDFEVTQDGLLATNRGAPRHADELFAYEPVLTLHQDAERPESLLFRPDGFVRGPDGSYFVADSGNHRIAVFDAEGTYERRFGREGQGPGEFGGAVGIERISGDVLELVDFSGERTHRFRTDGTLLETLAIPGEGRLLGLSRRPDGTRVVRRSINDYQNDVVYRRVAIGVFPPEGDTPLAELSTRSLPYMLLSTAHLEGGGIGTVAATMPYVGPATAVEVPGRGFLVAEGDRPQVAWYGYDANLVRRAVLDLRPVAVTAAMQRDYAEAWRESQAAADASGRRLPAPLPDLQFPDTAGFWASATVDDRGYVWLEDVVASVQRHDREGWTFHVIDPEGRYLGVTRAPVGEFRIQDGHLLGMVEDPSTAEPRPTVFALRPSAGGFEYASG